MVSESNLFHTNTGFDTKFLLLKFKRIKDVTLATVLVLLLLPVFFAVAVLVKLTSQGPILYKVCGSVKITSRFI